MICPIMAAGGNMQISAQCAGKACEWWVSGASMCAVPVIAVTLADSDLCRTIWESDRD